MGDQPEGAWPGLAVGAVAAGGATSAGGLRAGRGDPATRHAVLPADGGGHRCRGRGGKLLHRHFPLFIGIIPMESVDARRGATALSLVMGSAQIAGSVVGPLLGGVLADRFSLAAPFWASLVLSPGTAVIGLVLEETSPARAKPKTRSLNRS